ncbi:MAG: ATP-dependent RecD-like DNA helicase [Acidobacteriota bacterium]|nr:ATP-dependent RecD-like DNA helicase [Acidobacteriota bacterium]
METLEGTIESVLFFNPDNGYSVFRFAVEGRDKIVIVGTFPPLAPGERIKVEGAWETNPKFGPQLKVACFQPVLPAGLKGIEKYLSCGLIKGIGPALAKRIVAAFGADTLDVLEKKPERMTEVSGIGAAKLADIKASWSSHRDIRDLIIFLQEHDVSTSLANKIYRQYGPRSYEVLRTNPYQLCLDIWGIGFKTADSIALKLGTDPASPERIKAYLLYLMEKDNEQGHVYSQRSMLLATAARDLGVAAAAAEAALDALVMKRAVITEGVEGDTAVYRPFFYEAQEEVVRALERLSRAPFEAPSIDVDKVVAEVERELRVEFSPLQKQAIADSVGKKIVVITGGPGTGKTTLIKAVTAVFAKWGKQVLLGAPTGRAAKRLSEATGLEAKTIHRLLEFNPKLGSFRRDARHPLAGEAVIIDEFSMVDLALMHSLIKAVPPSMRMILVGDKDQLPALGPGQILRDLIEARPEIVVRLDRIFRQEADSLIVQNAHRVNQGEKLLYPPRGEKNADFYFIRQEEEAKVFSTIMKLVGWSIPQRFGLRPLSNQIQVISPMYKGFVGIERLNTEMQSRLNGRSEGLRIGLRELRVRDKVMQVRNDYEKDVFNGDIGHIVHVDKSSFRVIVQYDGRPVVYERDELDDITLAYAVSVHKSQGSEYQAVVMPLLTQHFIMLQRNLFYTALTRAKKLSVIIGSYKALYIAIKNDKPVHRNSRLKEKLLEAAARPSGFDLT